MRKYTLERARAYEKKAAAAISAHQRPAYHLSPITGWMNDPNGFSYYNGEYHLFYQYHPYKTSWAAMHWGHAVSHDLLHWRYLPAALAPDQDYDSLGCFSGTAATLPDGRQLLIYTGVHRGRGGHESQAQCVAVGDGLDYRKAAQNPVISEDNLPQELSPYDFRDPRIWKTEDGFRCIVGACTRKEHLGIILQYASKDGLDWRFIGELARNDGSHGRMWECPDFFPLDGRWVLSVSPQDMLPVPFKYVNGNGTVCMIGDLDETGTRFLCTDDQPVDYGMDFYAPQTIQTPDGRTVMIAWMQNWDTTPGYRISPTSWFGQMTVPRELSVRDGRLYQLPVRELESLRRGRVSFRNVYVNGEMELEGVKGRCVDIELEIRPADSEAVFNKFAVKFAAGGRYYTTLSFHPQDRIMKIDRKFSGSRRAIIHQRRASVSSTGGVLKMRLILDRFSAEIFLNDGEQVMTANLYTDPSADGISFLSEGAVSMNLVKYDLVR